MNTINIGLLGLGTVGSGVYQLLSRDNDIIKRRLDAELRVKKILVRDIAKSRPLQVAPELLTDDAAQIIADPEIAIVVELIGGTALAKDLIEQAIAAGKSIVTANKELMANFGGQVLDAADKRGVDLYFEASVAGGIPIVRPLKDSLVGNNIRQVMGIVNGTTNYILTKMADGREFADVLAKAQKLGYAERNPEADISGSDAGAKMAILASIAFNSRVTAGEVFTEGISQVSAKDIMYARELGYAIKLIALAKEDHGALDVRVHPTMIPLDHPLAAVHDVYNAIFVVGDAVGELMFFGKGAGSLPTASAVVGDIFEAALNLRSGQRGKTGCTCFRNLPVKSINEVKSSFYMLIQVADRPGVLAKIAHILGNNQVSVGSVIQKQSSGEVAELVFMTHLVTEGNLRTALSEIAKLDVVEKVCNVIRVEAGENG